MADPNDRKASITAQLDRARSRITFNRRELSGDLNVPARLKASIDDHRGVWLTVAGLVGLIIAKIPPRTKKVVLDRKGVVRKEQLEEVGKFGLVLGVLKVVLNLAKPLIISWATKRFASGARGRADYRQRG